MYALGQAEREREERRDKRLPEREPEPPQKEGVREHLLERVERQCAARREALAEDLDEGKGEEEPKEGDGNEKQDVRHPQTNAWWKPPNRRRAAR